MEEAGRVWESVLHSIADFGMAGSELRRRCGSPHIDFLQWILGLRCLEISKAKPQKALTLTKWSNMCGKMLKHKRAEVKLC